MSNHKLFDHWRLDAAGLALIAGLSVVAYFGLISPAIARHEQAQAQAADLLVQRTKARELEHSARTTADQVTLTLKAIEKTHFKLEPVSALNDRLGRLTEIAGANHLQVDTIESGATSSYPRFATINIRISGRGNYRNCANMLRQIREQMTDVGVAAMQITSSAVNTDKGATFVFDMLWYTQAQQKAAQK